MNAHNVKRFTARNSREALALVRQAFGEDAVVLSTRPSDGGGVDDALVEADARRRACRNLGGDAGGFRLRF